MAPRAILLVALLVLLPGGDADSADDASAACNLTQLSTALDALLAPYERAQPPAAPTRVALALAVRHATVADGAVRLLADLHLSWEEPRLRWNASAGELGGCDGALVSAERLWRPDVGVLSAAVATAAADAGDAPRAALQAAGRVAWLQRLDLQAPLTLDLSAWPRDTHRVVFKFGSRTHFVDEIELDLKDDDKEGTVFESGAWELVAVEAEAAKLVRAGAATRVAVYAVTLRRRAAAHALAAGAALAAAALLLLAAAALPPQARAPLCGAASFTAALWLASAVAQVGEASSAPRVLCALGALCACGGAAAAAAALALRVARCSRPAPAALRRLRAGPAALGWFTSLEVQGGEESGAWLAAGQLLDALCVLALLLAVLLTALLAAALG